MKKVLATVAEAWVLVLAFLLPLKFGGFAVIPESGVFFPEDGWSYLVVNWSPSVFSLVSAAALVLAVLAHPENLPSCRTASGMFVLLWVAGLVPGAFPGWIHLSTKEFVFLQTEHFAGLSCCLGAFCLVLSAGERERKHFAAALGSGLLLAVWFGLEQFFWGFDRAREFLEKQAADGVQIDEVMRARTYDTRVYGTFTSGNSLAGYLLLLTPFFTVLAWKIGGKVEPPRLSRVLFAGTVFLGAFSVFLMTKSRAGFLALALTAGIALFFTSAKRWKKGVFAALILCGIAAGAWYIHARGRGFLSMEARADYWRSSVILLAENPLAGCGWGNFFFDHARIKNVRDHEASHDPHNLLMTMMQAGILPVLFLAAGMICPVAALLKQRKARPLAPEERAGLFGLAAFSMHAMMDIDLQIPGLMGAYFALSVLLLCGMEHPPCRAKGLPGKTGIPAVFLLAAGTVWFANRNLRGEIALDRLQNLTRLGALSAADRLRVTPERVDEALRRAVAARPESSIPRIAGGDYYLSLGDLDRAEYEYREALKCSPKRSMLYARLAQIELLRGNRPLAEEFLAEAHRLFPHNPAYFREKFFSTEIP